jgi:hypothetical protein
VTRIGALPLTFVMAVAGAAACGRSDLDGLQEPPEDASTRDAALDVKSPHLEANVADSFVGEDQSTPADSALEGSPSRDAAEGADASDEASTSDAGDASAGDDGNAGDASEAGEVGAPTSACDQCPRGDQQCGPLPQVCTYDDGGVLHCGVPGQSLWTCALGDAGCAVWDEGLACRPDVPCCVPCMFHDNCPAGALGDPCVQDTDCAFDACDALTHVCVSDPCRDHRWDGQETDVDCGGAMCSACSVGQRCQSNLDCQSGHLCAASHLCE